MKTKRFLVFGAHPDDSELMFGGCAAKLAGQGHQVKFVACCNGDAGHHLETRGALAVRRAAEARRSAAVGGLADYEVLDSHDCELEVTLANRARVIGIIRDFQPDVVISHRTCDYHADHRATAQLVQDAAYLVMVPLCCPDHPAPPRNPIFLFSHDRFKRPYPFTPSVAVAIDDALSTKLGMMDCHVSQFYEWLPHVMGQDGQAPSSPEGRERWLTDGWLVRDRAQADAARGLLVARYGEVGRSVVHAETFELSEYGRQPEIGELEELLPL